ncbi:hypothetical protein BESB_081600 [Besnoitia besnoiti]|uniref:Uncharacterized protein n=1 Tax=Besnoitia besnoiti TaxID=94643 RepID=A0A2A9M9H0_BESBE|nr:hypothetical protein BESB_081600 [Besnoitia besnoiti]PFH32961.1 hypothetical protein BESB_081600 [Besnoitia besnoiti]
MHTLYRPRENIPYREGLEKARLKSRREKFARVAVVADPVQPAADLPFVASFANDHERNARREEKSLSQADKQRKEAHQALFNQARRRKIETREALYQAVADREEAKELNRIQFLRERSKSYPCREGFDIVSLEYKRNEDGRKLRVRDRYAQYRQELRGYTLALRSGFCNNPITGDGVLKLQRPAKPPGLEAGASEEQQAEGRAGGRSEDAGHRIMLAHGSSSVKNRHHGR